MQHLKSHRHYTYLEEEDSWLTAAAGLRSGAAWCGPAAFTKGATAGPVAEAELLVVAAKVTSFLLLVGVAVTELALLALLFIAEDYKNFDVHYIVSQSGLVWIILGYFWLVSEFLALV